MSGMKLLSMSLTLCSIFKIAKIFVINYFLSAMTVRNGGNVLIPCYPSGVTFDLFECLSSQLESTGNLTVPMFFLSPVAENSLAYSNILADW